MYPAMLTGQLTIRELSPKGKSPVYLVPMESETGFETGTLYSLPLGRDADQYPTEEHDILQVFTTRTLDSASCFLSVGPNGQVYPFDNLSGISFRGVENALKN